MLPPVQPYGGIRRPPDLAPAGGPLHQRPGPNRYLLTISLKIHFSIKMTVLYRHYKKTIIFRYNYSYNNYT